MKAKIIKVGNLKIKLLTNNMVFMPSKRSLFLANPLSKLDLLRKKVIDVGVGSGFLSILSAKLGAAEILALDINPLALFQTKKNWKLNDLGNIFFTTKLSDVFEELKEYRWKGHFDLIISNPPVLPTQILDKLELKKFSPWMWNGAGNDGRAVVDKILNEGPDFLKKGGLLLLVHSSRLGLNKTENILNKKFSSWHVINEKNFKLESHFTPFLNLWLKDKKKIFQKKGTFFETVKIIKAVK